jgi:hypothetical protein
MRIIDTLIGELEQEAKATARVLERVPEAHLTWKPHPKSYSLGQLALHVATVPGNVAALAASDVAQAPGFAQPAAAAGGELMRRWTPASPARDLSAASTTAIPPWRLVNGERNLSDAARGVRARDHAQPCHHRVSCSSTSVARRQRCLRLRPDRGQASAFAAG